MKHPILNLSLSSIQGVADDTITYALEQYCRLKTLKHGGGRAKRESVTRKRYADEIFQSGLLSRKKTITKKHKRKLYLGIETEFDKVAGHVKIHYVGYSKQFDIRRPCGSEDKLGQAFSAVGTSLYSIFSAPS